MNILALGDSHIDDKAPVCRRDENYLETVFLKLRFIVETALENKVDAIIHAGDLFERSRPDQAQLLEIMIMDVFKPLRIKGIPFITIPGNHDLPYHNLNNLNRSSLGVLGATGTVQILNKPHTTFLNQIQVTGFPYGVDIENKTGNNFGIAVIHEYIFERSVPPFMTGYTVRDLVELYPGWEIIISGHNHQSFAREIDGTLVINPGGILRTTGADLNKKPRIALIDIDDVKGTLKWIEIPVIRDNVSAEHLDAQHERDERISAFVDQMKNNSVSGLDFIANLEKYIKENKLDDELKNKIWEIVQ